MSTAETMGGTGPGTGSDKVNKADKGLDKGLDKKADKKAEKVDKKAEKVDKAVQEQHAAANGDVINRDPQYSEPKGTLHSDQFTTSFPSEKNTTRRS